MFVEHRLHLLQCTHELSVCPTAQRCCRHAHFTDEETEAKVGGQGPAQGLALSGGAGLQACVYMDKPKPHGGKTCCTRPP